MVQRPPRPRGGWRTLATVHGFASLRTPQHRRCLDVALARGLGPRAAHSTARAP